VTEKACTKCGETKPLEDFNRLRSAKDGHEPRCRECRRQERKAWRENNPGAERESRKRRYQRNRDHEIKGIAKWKREHPERVAATAKRYYERHSKKHEARRLVSEAIRDGVLVRPEACEICEGRDSIQAHHPDYDRPLDVEWLCLSCHTDTHARLA